MARRRPGHRGAEAPPTLARLPGPLYHPPAPYPCPHLLAPRRALYAARRRFARRARRRPCPPDRSFSMHLPPVSRAPFARLFSAGARPRAARRPPPASLVPLLLVATACAGSTLRSGVGDTILERSPYYAGSAGRDTARVGHFPVGYQ